MGERGGSMDFVHRDSSAPIVTGIMDVHVWTLYEGSHILEFEQVLAEMQEVVAMGPARKRCSLLQKLAKYIPKSEDLVSGIIIGLPIFQSLSAPSSVSDKCARNTKVF